MNDEIIALEQVNLDRYPGIRPFQKGESALFFGRESEVEELLHSIKVHDIMVLYSKSGLGKSSLVNAGLSPRLLEENIHPIDIRFHASAEKKPYDKILSEVKCLIPKKDLEAVPASLKDDLWALFSQWHGSEIPLLIFDQFEEFFYYDRSVQGEAIAQLAGLLSKKVPDYLFEKLSKEKFDNEGQRRSFLNKPPVKLLFLIRSDKLSYLGELSNKLPQILSNRYHLKPLGMEKAEQAISMPAQLINEAIRFNTHPYEYSDASLKIILRSLSNKDNEIESSQLQIVCQEMEKIAEEKWKGNEDEIVILPDDFGGEKGIKKIINDFYWNQLGKLQVNKKLSLSDDDIKVVRNLIENELLSGNKRIIQSDDRVYEMLSKINPGKLELDGVKKEVALVEELLNLRLIRVEESHLGKVLEISHDTLVESIVEAREERIKKEQAEKLIEQQKELEEEKKRLEKEIKLKEKARAEREKAQMERERALAAEQKARISESEALRAKGEALKAKEDAEDAWQIALQENKKMLKARKKLRFTLAVMVILFIGVLLLLIHANNIRLQNKLRTANEFIKKGNYSEAKKELHFSDATRGINRLINFPGLDSMASLNARISNLTIKSEKYDSLIEKANRYINESGDSLKYAYELYKEAEALQYEPAAAEKSMKILLMQLRTRMNKAFEWYVDKAEAFSAAEKREDAQEAMKIAGSLNIDTAIGKNIFYMEKYRNLLKEISEQK